MPTAIKTWCGFDGLRAIIVVRTFAFVCALTCVVGCAEGMRAASKCQSDLGVSWAPASCMDAVQDADNRKLADSVGDEACARARLATSDVALGNAMCEEWRLKAKKAAWTEIERAAVDRRTPRLVLDEQLVPGLPTGPSPVAAASPTFSAPATKQPESPLPAPRSLAPQQEASSSIAGSTLTLGNKSNADTGSTDSFADQVTNAQMGSIEYLDARAGFRDVKFGQPPKAGMVLKENDGATKYYRRPSDDLTMGAGKVSEIDYGYYKNRLEAVLLISKGFDNSRAVLATLQAAYGPGSQPNEYLEQYFWLGNAARVFYDENLISHDSTITLTSVSLSAEEEGDKKSAAERSGGNL